MDPRDKPIPRIRAFAAPAAGAAFTFRPDTAAGFLFKTFRYQCTTDANVATREHFISVSDGNAEWFRTGCGASQTATQTREYAAFEGAVGGTSTLPVRLIDWPKIGVWVPPGNTLTLSMEGIQAGDVFASIAAYVIEFPTGPRFAAWPFPHYLTEESE